MLPQDKGGVVDHNLKVYGTNNLRVVDLSVVPLHFDAHTQGGFPVSRYYPCPNSTMSQPLSMA